jgi:hypothetical protein
MGRKPASFLRLLLTRQILSVSGSMFAVYVPCTEIPFLAASCVLWLFTLTLCHIDHRLQSPIIPVHPAARACFQTSASSSSLSPRLLSEEVQPYYINMHSVVQHFAQQERRQKRKTFCTFVPRLVLQGARERRQSAMPPDTRPLCASGRPEARPCSLKTSPHQSPTPRWQSHPLLIPSHVGPITSDLHHFSLTFTSFAGFLTTDAALEERNCRIVVARRTDKESIAWPVSLSTTSVPGGRESNEVVESKKRPELTQQSRTHKLHIYL